MEVPFICLRKTVPHEWIDINGHMNATHYTLAVYEAHVNMTEMLGLGESYVNSTQCSKAVLESHLIYEREVKEGEELEIRSWLLAVDKKRLHFFHEVYNLTTGERAAAAEQVDVHVDLVKRCASEFPESLYQSLQEIVTNMLALPTPAGVGSRLRPPKNVWLDILE